MSAQREGKCVCHYQADAANPAELFAPSGAVGIVSAADHSAPAALAAETAVHPTLAV